MVCPESRAAQSPAASVTVTSAMQATGGAAKAVTDPRHMPA